MNYLFIIVDKPREDPAVSLHCFHSEKITVHIRPVSFLPADARTYLYSRAKLLLAGLQNFALMFHCFFQGHIFIYYVLYFFQRHVKHPEHSDQFQSPDVFFRIIAVSVAVVPGRFQQSHPLVITDILPGHPCQFLCLFRIQAGTSFSLILYEGILKYINGIQSSSLLIFYALQLDSSLRSPSRSRAAPYIKRENIPHSCKHDD